MRHLKRGLTLAGIAALLLTACGGGGGGSGSSSSGGGSNTPPVANAGPAQSVNSGVVVTLNGTGSADPDGSLASYAWTQTSGGAVALTSANGAQPSFTAPSVTTASTLTFSLVVTDNRGASSTASTVDVVVNPLNVLPVANAGTPLTVTSGVTVTLNGSASSDADGTIALYTWSQTAGAAVALSSNSAAQPTFTAPMVAAATAYTFSLVVTDNLGATSTASTVTITVNPLVAGNVNVTGKVRFQRVRFLTTGQRPLDYSSPVLQPSRGVTVRALDATTFAQLATGTTDANGDYALTVAANTNIVIEVVARLQKTGTAPTWDVRVQDGVSGTSPFTHRTAEFSSAAGITRNIDLLTGVNASGQATGTRSSAPFAILDTVYTAIQAVVGVAPTLSFPALIVDWGSQAQGTFFTSTGGQHIALLSNLTEDTDEFDQHVIAHEFGHYIEFNFSRADNIGGAHALGDRLDPRVAFGEGFGYAFAAIVLDDPNARDSYVNNGTLASSGFNVELNPSGTSGCWCSESSVYSILYDIHDSAADTNDTLALGLQPIWNVLINAQKDTPAFTTIFSFISALKAAQPGNAAAINTLVSAQNIDAGSIDAFGTGETHFPANVPQAAALPLYKLATVGGGAVVAPTVNDAGSTLNTSGNFNKIGARRFYRFSNASQRNVTITLATSNPDANQDPDFLLWRAGTFVGASTSAPPGPETRTFNNLPAGEYLIEAYDCANGCAPPEGVSGDYDLTVTITAP